MNGAPRYGHDVALFIDWENFKISLAAGNRAPNVSALKEEVSNHGRVVVAKAYADWVSRAPELKGASQFINDPPALYAAGIEPVYVPTRLPVGSSPDSFRTFRVKNSVDVKMTADCIECAHSYENISTFVLVSGDSDFIHVINALRTMGKRVIIIGVSWSTSRRLADQVDGLILYDADVDPVAAVEPAPATNGQATTRLASPTRRQLPDVMRVIEDIVRTERQAGRIPLLTSLKQRVMRRIPGFDDKKLGFSGFKKLMQRVSEEGNIKLVTVGLVDWTLMADEPEPEEVLTEASQEDVPEGVEATAASDQVEILESPSEESSSDEPEESLEAIPSGINGRSGESDVPPEELSPEEDIAEETEIPVAEVVVEPAIPEPELPTAVVEAIARLDLPKGADDQQEWNRVSDLIIAADTLEGQEGAAKVAFNFLVSQVCDALSQGLEAQDATINRHWGQVYSRSYVTKLVRSLDGGGVFQRGWHTFKDEDTGRRKRQRTFNLDRSHVLVQQALQTQWGIYAPPPDDSLQHPEADAVAEEPVDERPVNESVALVGQPEEGVEVPSEETPADESVALVGQPEEGVEAPSEETPADESVALVGQPEEGVEVPSEETPADESVALVGQPEEGLEVPSEVTPADESEALVGQPEEGVEVPPEETPTDDPLVLVSQPEDGNDSFGIDGEPGFSTTS